MTTFTARVDGDFIDVSVREAGWSKRVSNTVRYVIQPDGRKLITDAGTVDDMSPPIPANAVSETIRPFALASFDPAMAAAVTRFWSMTWLKDVAKPTQAKAVFRRTKVGLYWTDWDLLALDARRAYLVEISRPTVSRVTVNDRVVARWAFWRLLMGRGPSMSL